MTISKLPSGQKKPSKHAPCQEMISSGWWFTPAQFWKGPVGAKNQSTDTEIHINDHMFGWITSIHTWLKHVLPGLSRAIKAGLTEPPHLLAAQQAQALQEQAQLPDANQLRAWKWLEVGGVESCNDMVRFDGWVEEHLVLLQFDHVWAISSRCEAEKALRAPWFSADLPGLRLISLGLGLCFHGLARFNVQSWWPKKIENWRCNALKTHLRTNFIYRIKSNHK